MRWIWWFGAVPQLFLLAGYLRDFGLPPIDMAVFGALFLAWFAEVRALPMLLLAVAIGRALVDQASLPVHLLVIGVPVAVLLPLRSLFVAQHWLWQVMAASSEYLLNLWTSAFSEELLFTYTSALTIRLAPRIYTSTIAMRHFV